MLIGKKHILVIYLFLTVITLIAFLQLNQCDFINYDDPLCVTENVHIQNGITIEAIRWAFTTGHSANWHPLTWMSHMLDVQLFGLNPQWHHLINLLFHIANTLLLFFVFHRMTKAPWKSAFVAALFAVHPLHVESVAWVAERKDVLSTFFWMLTMCAYAHYVEHRTEDGRQRTEYGEKWTGIFRFPSSVFRYSAVFTFFALGLMAKPMLVTLPFVLLLLDYWPLRRFEQKKSAQVVRAEVNKPVSANKRKGKSSRKSTTLRGVELAEKPVDHKYSRALIRPLLREKIPLFALAALSCIVTFVAQQKGGAVVSLEGVPPDVRIANAFVSYIIYIGKTIWPDNLAVFYPHPGWRPIWQVAGAILLLAAVTLTVIRRAKRFPFLAVGWLWFAGTLVPVVGIVQVGNQAMADRYAYVPLIGLFVMAAWGIPELLKNWRYRKEALSASSALSLSCLFIVTWTQVGYWRNSISLYDHTLKVTSHNDVIHSNRGVAYGKLGNQGQAIEDYDKAIEINPKYADAYRNRGVAYARLGRDREAIEDYNRSIEIDPKIPEAYNNRGVAYDKLGNQRQAIDDYNRAVEIDSELAWAYNGRGAAYAKLGNLGQAIEDLNRAVRINPKFADAYNNRGVTYGMLGNLKQAIEDFDKAIEINPKFADAYNNRGVTYGKLGKPQEGTEDVKTAARFDHEGAKNYLRSHGVDW